MAFSGGSSTGGFGSGINITVALRGARETAAQADVAAAGVERVGAAARTSAVRAEEAAGGWTYFGNKLGFASKKAEGGVFSFKKLRGAVGGFTAAFVGYLAVKNAITTTEQLTESTIKLKTGFGATTTEAGNFAAIAQELGIPTQTLAMGWRSLAMQQSKFMEGSDKARGYFQALGITQSDLAATGGDVAKTFELVIRHLDGATAGSSRATAGAALLGRSFQAFLPLAAQHAHLLDVLGKSNDGLVTDASLKKREELVQKEFEWRGALLNLKVAIADNLTPAVSRLMDGMTEFLKQGREGKGVAGALVDVYHALSDVLSTVLGFLQKHKTLTKDLTLTVLGLWAAVKIYTAAMAVWEMGSATVTGVHMAFLMLKWDLAAIAIELGISVGWIALIILAAVALGAGVELLVLHFGGWHKVMHNIWSWIKTNWMDIAGLILLPFAPMIGLPLLIIHHWGAIESFFTKTVPGWLDAAGGAIVDALEWPFKEFFSWLGDQYNNLPGPVRGVLSNVGGGLSWAGSGLSTGASYVGLANGGDVFHRPGSAWVTGERGPELNSFSGSKVRVQPLTSGAKVEPLNWDHVSESMADSREITIRVPVHLDRKQVGEVMTSYMKDVRARR